MGKFWFFLYAAGVGYYVRASGLDKELAELTREAYDATVLHTAAVLRRAEVGRAAGLQGNLLEDEREQVGM